VTSAVVADIGRQAVKSSIFETEDAARVDVRAEALINDAFMHVIHTGPHAQIAVMTLPPDDETGDEVHPDTDQLIVFVEGVAEARIGEYSLDVRPGDLVFVEAGTRHNIVNRATLPLRLITVFAPPAHPAGTILRTKEERPTAEIVPDIAHEASSLRRPLRPGPRLRPSEETLANG
jgi:mannose-6-phosphate isomerase-like protein (cupin superfamily)